jgi:hypothetical protein
MQEQKASLPVVSFSKKIMEKRGRKTNLHKAQDLKTLKQQQKQAAHFFKPVSETKRRCYKLK